MKQTVINAEALQELLVLGRHICEPGLELVQDESLGGVTYCSEVGRVISLIWEAGLGLTGYDWPGDHKFLKALITKPNGIEKASLQDLRKLLTYMTRGERFSGGLFGCLIRQGVLNRVLTRLTELVSISANRG